MPPSTAAPDGPTAVRHKLLLVGWDGADPKLLTSLLERRHMPALERLVERGSLGKVSSLAPALSPVLWTSIATGKRPDKHGVLVDREVDAATGIFDRVTSRTRTATPVWTILQRSGIRTQVVNWPASHPVSPSVHANSVLVSDRYWTGVAGPDTPWPLLPGTVHPERLHDPMAGFRVHPAEITASDLLPFIPGLRQLGERRDRRLIGLANILAEAASVHAAATWLLEHEPWDFAAIQYPGLERLAHTFGACCPPCLPSTSAADASLLGDVLVCGYRFHDLMLARLVELAGEDTTVVIVSDHGIQLGDRRGPAGAPDVAWHHGAGFLCVAGPGLCTDELIHGASILDIAPTVLTHFGLPVGADMDGRPLLALWRASPPVAFVATHEQTPDATCLGESEPGSPDYEDALDELRALGYGVGASQVLARVTSELEQSAEAHLAIAYVQAGRFADAAGVLRRLVEANPDYYIGQLYLAFCLYRIGDLTSCRHILDDLPASAGVEREQALITGMVLIAENRAFDAIAHLRAAEGLVADPLVLSLLGSARLRVGEYDSAAAAFARALAIDEEFADAHLGLAQVAARQRRWEDVVHCTLATISVDHHRPAAHYLLGVALFNLNLPDRALVAFTTALQMAPTWKHAEDWIRHLEQGTIRPPLASSHVRLRI